MALAIACAQLKEGHPALAEGSLASLESYLKKNGITPKTLFRGKVKVLEVGSGNSAFLNLAKQKGVNIFGVDVDFNYAHNVPQVIARIEQLPYADNSFDVVFSRAVFDQGVYDQNPVLMVSEIKRILKPGGIYVGEEFENLPNIDGLVSIENNPMGKIYKKSK